MQGGKSLTAGGKAKQNAGTRGRFLVREKGKKQRGKHLLGKRKKREGTSGTRRRGAGRHSHQ